MPEVGLIINTTRMPIMSFTGRVSIIAPLLRTPTLYEYVTILCDTFIILCLINLDSIQETRTPSHNQIRETRQERIHAMLDLSHITPDSEGINFYTADPDLSFLLGRHLSLEDNDRAQGILTEMGAVASRKMDELAGVANRQGPVLVQFDKKGQRIDEVVFHPAYHELERIAYQDFAIAACSHRDDAL